MTNTVPVDNVFLSARLQYMMLNRKARLLVTNYYLKEETHTHTHKVSCI